MLRVRTVLAVVLLGNIASCRGEHSRVVLPPEGVAVTDSQRTYRRHIMQRDWTPLFTHGAEDGRDSLLVAPYLLGSAGNLVLVMELDQRITAFDESGRLRWRAGRRGGGPLEFQSVRDFEYDGGGTILVHDPDVRRLTALDTLGNLSFVKTLGGLPHSDQFVRVGPGRYALFGDNGHSDLYVIDSAGGIVSEDSFVWSGYGKLNRLVRQLSAVHDVKQSDHWVVTLKFGNAWLAFDGTTPQSGRRFYVEATPFPAVVETRSRTEYTSRLLSRTLAAMSSGLAGDTLFTLFWGSGDDASRLIDLYSWSTGNYLGTWRLPEPVDAIALTPSTLVTLQDDPYPRLTGYRR